MRVIPITLLALTVASCGQETNLVRSGVLDRSITAEGLASELFFRAPEDPFAGPMIAAPHLGLPRGPVRERLAARTTVTVLPFPETIAPDAPYAFPDSPEPTILSPAPKRIPTGG